MFGTQWPLLFCFMCLCLPPITHIPICNRSNSISHNANLAFLTFGPVFSPFRPWTRSWRVCIHAREPTIDMHWLVRIFLVLSGVTGFLAVEACTSPSQGQAAHCGINCNATGSSHIMRRSADGGIPGGRKKLPISLGFKCAYCGAEFGSRAGMDIHRRHRSSLGTPCADPMNSKSMSLTQRGDKYTGTLRQHDTHGVCAYSSFGSLFFTLPPQVPSDNVYNVHTTNNSVIIVHNVKQSELFCRVEPDKKYFIARLWQLLHWFFQCHNSVIMIALL